MKVHVLTVIVADHDNLGIELVKASIEQERFTSPRVVKAKTFDVGDWYDEHPLNQPGTDSIEWLEKSANEEGAK